MYSYQICFILVILTSCLLNPSLQKNTRTQTWDQSYSRISQDAIKFRLIEMIGSGYFPNLNSYLHSSRLSKLTLDIEIWGANYLFCQLLST